MISIIIPNYNGKEFLGPCLAALSKQTYTDFEIIVVDNGSTDRSVDFLKQNYPQVKLISLPENMGFSYAVNRGIEQSKGKYIALLNNDTKTDKRWLAEVVRVLEDNKEAGFCASKIFFMDRPNLINSAGDLYQRNGRARNIGLGETDTEQFNNSTVVFGACAAAAIYRRELFENIGLFDEDYFVSYEDVDISFRAQLGGYKCLYVPNAIVYHHGGGTTGKKKTPFGDYYSSKNLVNTLVKDMPVLLLFKYSPFIIWYQIRTLGIFIRGWHFGVANMKGKFAAIGQLPKMLKKRWEIQKNRRVPIAYIDSIITK